MNKVKRNRLEMAKVLIIAIVIYLLAMGVCILVKTYDCNITQIDMSKNWTYSVNGEKQKGKVAINDRFDGLKNGDKLEFTRNITNIEDIQFPTMNIEFMWCDVKVHYGKKMIYSHKYVKSLAAITESEIVLNDYDKDKKLKIELTIKNSDKEFFVMNCSVLEEHEILGYRLRNSMVSYVLGGAMAIFGLIVCIITIVVKNKNDEIRKMFWIGITFILLAVFMITKKKIWIYLMEATIGSEICMYVTMILVIPCIYMIHLYMYHKEYVKKIFSISFLILLGLPAVFIIGEDTAFKNMDVSMGVGTSFGVLMLAAIILGICDWRYAKGLDRFFEVGMYIIYTTIFIIVITLLVDDYPTFIKVFDGGIMFIVAIMLLFVMLYYCYRMKEYMDGLSENKVLAALAYTDPLTGIMNRAKFDEVMEELRSKRFNMCTVISFDLNNLKVVNDANGHDAGDDYIRFFAKALRIGFEEDGFIGRIGGDEFIAIIKDKYVNVEGTIEVMQNILSSTMKKYKDVNATFAYGSALCRRDEKKSIDELVELADSRMYICKKEQKEECEEIETDK